MDCTNINTTAEILNAFRTCNNPDEEIALFECLATRLDPPVREFFEFLQKIKLEPVLALTIQAFGKISNPDIKARLKESTDLLEMLSYQAQSGSSDLIRWSAATAIEQIGFDFLMVAQYLSEDPKKIAERIVLSIRNLSSRDSNELSRFYAYYQPLYKQKKQAQKCRCISTILTEHSDYITALAISSKWPVLSSSSQDKTIKLWNYSTGKELCMLTGHSESVTSLAISPDGQTLVSGSCDNTIKLWQLSTGRELRTLKIDSPDYSNWIHSIAISPDGQTLISVSGWEQINLWQLNQGNITQIWNHPEKVDCLAISPDGQILAIGSQDNTIILRQLSTGQRLRTLTGHSNRVVSLAISPNGETLVSGSQDNTIKLWQLNTGQELCTLIGHSYLVSSIAISPDGQTIVSGSGDNTIKIWHLATGKEIHAFCAHYGMVAYLAFSADGNTLISCNPWGEKEIKIWRWDEF